MVDILEGQLKTTSNDLETFELSTTQLSLSGHGQWNFVLSYTSLGPVVECLDIVALPLLCENILTTGQRRN